jgi:glutathione reductase (NADPH)
MLRYGIPQYRLPKIEVLDGEYQSITRLGGRFECGKMLGRDFTTADLKAQGYDAVIVAIGCYDTNDLGIPGEDAEGVIDGLDYLHTAALGLEYPNHEGSRVVVVGGGYIACEFASIFKGLGARVTQLYRGTQVLRGFDDEVRAFIAAEMLKAGVDLRLNADVAAIVKAASGLHITLQDGSSIEADAVLYATGRVPLVQGLELDALGIAQKPDGAIVVNESYQTSVPHIYAVGDVTARVQLTPVALGEAMVVVDHLLGAAAGKAPRSMSYDFIPTAVFTHPNIGTVGLTEAQARERFGAVRVFKSEFKALMHTLSGSSERTFMKLLVDEASDRVVGLHMVGAEAGEIVQGFAVAMKAGATKAVFDSTIGIHPTAAEEFVTMREPVKA